LTQTALCGLLQRSKPHPAPLLILTGCATGNPMHATLQDWINREAVPVSEAAIDTMMASMPEVELLGFGEALHGGEEILLLRNRLFQRLVETHGFRAIAIESSFPAARLVTDYILGRGPATYDEVKDAGFSHGFGRLEANRELVEWMRQYNSTHERTLHFYGFDIPTGTTGVGSPRQLLNLALEQLGDEPRRQRIHELLGDDAQWENPEQYLDPSRCIGLSPAATALRIETENLITTLRTRSPELDPSGYDEALHCANLARQLLGFFAAMAARKTNEPPATLLAIREVMQADNLSHIAARERNRGKLLAFAHNGHLQRGKMSWPGHHYWGTDAPCRWWPAGAHLAREFGPRYAVIGTAVGVSEENGIAPPEPATLEARLMALPASAVLIPTRCAPVQELAGLGVRTASVKNQTYAPLTAQSLSDFDWIAFVKSTGYHRGGPPLQARDAQP
jgi:erythromycin esterase